MRRLPSVPAVPLNIVIASIMRIGIDARFFGPASKGLGRYTQKLIEYLEDVDSRNDYVIFLRKENFHAYTPTNPRFRKVVADYPWYSVREQLLFPFMLYKHRCDIIHFPHFNVPILYLRRFVVTIHDLILVHYPTKKATTRHAPVYWLKYLAYRVVIRAAIARAAHVIAVSRFTGNDVCATYPAAVRKITVIHEAADVPQTIPASDNAALLASHGVRQPFALYVGNAYPHKNLTTLVDAFARCRAAGTELRQLVIVGKDDYFYAQLRAHIAARGITDIVIMHTIDDALLWNLYAGATAFVFPSLYEGFGLPPLEAQLSGVPVISHDHPCMREVLSDHGALFCDTRDAQKLAAALRTIVRDRALRDALRRAGIANARRFSWHRMARDTHTLYLSLLRP